MDGIAGLVDWLYKLIVPLDRYSHYLPPQPLNQLSPNTLSPVIQQTTMLMVNSKNFSGAL